MSKDQHTPRQLMGFLLSSPVFEGCEEPALVKMLATCRVRQVPRGSVVFFQSDPGDAIYLVLSGSIAILLNSPDGRELVINQVTKGDFFGELALLTGEARSATALAREKSELLVIPGPALETLLVAQPQVIRCLLRLLARRLVASTEREGALAFLDASGRIVRDLLMLDQANEEKGYMVLSQEELAQRTGLTRQTVARILGKWRRAGWLLTGRGRIMLLNREALHQVAEQSAL